jgi:hypothetical protein
VTIHRSKRIGVLGGLGVGLVGFGLIVGAGLSVEPSGQPDLTALLPQTRPTARFVDTVEVPGKVLYRFDSVIFNQGGALDISRNAGDPTTFQTTWTNGVPFTATTSTRSLGGSGQIAYSSVTGHFHFHTQLAAGYQLDTTGGALVNRAAKNTAGFCLYDSWGQGTGIYANDCHAGEPGYTGAIREGISNGWGDFYGSDLGDQWVDVTGVAPGSYVLKATANPAGLYTESNTANNVVTDPVTIPGATAAPASAATTTGKAIDIPIAGTVVGPGEPSRKPTCSQAEITSASCITTAAPGKLTFAAATAPTAGSVTYVDAAGDLVAVARYTPPAGFTGTASFSYVTRDSRGLTSAPAVVRVTVGAAAATPPAGGGTGTTTPPAGAGAGAVGVPPAGTAKATVRLTPAFRLVRSGGKIFLKVTGTLPKAQAGRLVRVQRKFGKRIVTIGGVRVARTGRFSRLIRVHVTTLSVRTTLASSASTAAAASVFRRIS